MIKNQKGFTLIEMMIVLLVISVLLVITVPNVTKNNSSINEKGCEAFVNMVQGQVQAFELDGNKSENGELVPVSVAALKAGGYITQEKCPSGKAITIEDGKVTVVKED
jgi:competence protein ComGC